MEWRERDGVRWLEAELPGARAAFTTRAGGISTGAYESLNLGVLTGDEEPVVRENRRRAAAALGLELDRVLIGRQVHGADVVKRETAPEPNPFAAPGAEIDEVDGQATAARELAPLVFVADCLPIALRGPGGVAMIHGGWRGLASGIVESGVVAVDARAAAIGPAIGPCCYEVGVEVLAALERFGEGIAQDRMLDLTEVARRALAAAGVAEVEASELCTSCERELFFSHRRDGGVTGRQAGVVWAGDG